MSNLIFRTLFLGVISGLILSGCSNNTESQSGSGNSSNEPTSLSWEATSHDFEDTYLGQVKTKEITLTNTGSVNSKPIELKWMNKNQSSWQIQSDSCTNMVLSPLETCSIIVKYMPVSESSDWNVLMARDQTNAHVEFKIEGRGIASASDVVSFEVDKNSLDFGETQIGVSKTKNLVIRNSGTKNFSSLTSGISSGNFSVVSNSCQGTNISPNQNCLVKVSFSPNSIGDHQSSMTLTLGSEVEVISLSGTAKVSKAVLSVDPTTYSPSMILSVISNKTFTIKNEGEGVSSNINLEFQDGMNFEIINDSCSNKQLEIGEECSFVLKNLALWTTMSDKLHIKGGRNNLLINLLPTQGEVSSRTEPMASDYSYTIEEEATLSDVLRVSDPNNLSLSYQVVSSPTKGTVSVSSEGVFTYISDKDKVGYDSFDYKVINSNGEESEVKTISINIENVKDDVNAEDYAVQINENEVKTFSLDSTYVYDPEGGYIFITSVKQPTNGTIKLNPDNTLTYTPNSEYIGSDSFVYYVSSGGTQVEGTLNLQVNKVNNLPVSNSLSYTLNEDTNQSITLVGTDADGDPLTYTIVSGPTNGTLTGTEPNIVYTPNSNYYGADSFTYKVNDGETPGDSNIATVSLTINPVNDTPIADDQTINATEDTPVGITLTGSDVDGDSLTYTVVSGPSNGTLSGTVPNLTYTPNADYNGSDSFTFKVNDGTVDSGVATISINISADNDAPVALAGTTSTDEDTVLSSTLSATDADGDALTYAVVSQGSFGTVVITDPLTGAYTYTPNADYNGIDTFTFRVNDGATNSNVAAVQVTVNPVNDKPLADDKIISVNEDSSQGVILTGSDVDGDTLTYTVVSGPSNGTLSGTVPNLTYTPNADYNGSDSFTYKVNDGTVDSDIATVSITVNQVNDLPIANNDLIMTDEDTSVSITLTGSDTDGDSLTYTVVSGPTNGILSGTVPNLTYTPNADYNGSDSFTFKVNDGTGDSNTATVSITVNPVDDLTIANDQTVNVNEDEAKAITLTVNEVDGDSLTWTIVSGPSNGTLSGTEPNLVYTPDANYTGNDSFTFKVNDGISDSNTATVSLVVNDANDPPVAVDGNISTNKNTSKNISSYLQTLASDPENDSLTWIIVSGPSNGTLSGTAPSLTYAPNTGYTGSDSFTFKVNDGEYDSEVKTMSIDVIAPPNTAPSANNVNYTYALRNTDETIELSFSDVDGDSLTVDIVSSPSSGSASLSGNDVVYTPESWTYCANEGGTCSFSGTKLVKYGYGSSYIVKEATNSISCSNSEFTDPVIGTLKECYYINKTDSFTYRVYDGVDYSSTATVSITLKDWFDKNWGSRRKLAMTLPSISNDVEETPVLVKLNSSRIDYSKVQNSGQDLRFVDASGNVLSHEIEQWNEAGDSFVWVKTSIGRNDGSNKYIWVYYNNSSGADGQNVEDVWSNGYAAVWHLNQTSGQVLDSTGNNNHGTAQNINSRSSSGKMGNGYYATNNSACFSVPHNSSHVITDAITMEAWAKPTTSSQTSAIIQKDVYQSGNWYWAYSLGNSYNDITEVITDSSLNTTYYQTPDPYYVTNQWTYIAITYNDQTNETTGYDNGVMNVYNNSATRNMYNGSNWQSLNIMGDCSSDGFEGYLDEIRISNTDRNYSWIKVQYKSMNDTLINYNSEESL